MVKIVIHRSGLYFSTIVIHSVVELVHACGQFSYQLICINLFLVHHLNLILHSIIDIIICVPAILSYCASLPGSLPRHITNNVCTLVLHKLKDFSAEIMTA